MCACVCVCMCAVHIHACTYLLMFSTHGYKESISSGTYQRKISI